MLIFNDTLMIFTCEEIQERFQCQKILKKTYHRRVSGDTFFSVVDVLGFLKCLSALRQLKQQGAVPACCMLGSAAVLGSSPRRDSSPAVLLKKKNWAFGT